jgi:murein DD-endopeptidase MepM/ murein hydrolase activator NlpD
MSALEIGRSPRRSGLPRNSLVVLLIIGLLAGMYFLIPRFEWKSPQIKLTPGAETLGLGQLEIDITEQGTGLKSVSASLTAGGKEHSLAMEEYDQPLMQKKITIALSSKLTGLQEGPAVLRVSARDRSLWSFFRGNETVLQKNLTIDITPPTIELIADDAYVNFGGTALVAYKPSSDTVSSGVKIGNHFFPGYKGQTQDPSVYLAFFAHPYDTPETEKATLVATDKAGNARQMALAYILKGVKYKKSTIPISEEFIQGTVAPLINDVGARQGSAKELFVKVNRDIRKENEEKIKAVTQKTAGSMLWSGPFNQLTNSKVEANFADARTYIYKNETIDHAYHLGFDLSVTKRYPVEAANSGVVGFIGDLGIYGNTVILDHGLGLATLYSHLSSIDVKPGDQIKKAQILGKTGETGLAVGDHLHYGVYLNGIAVLPLEWWDEKWLRDNIYPKLQSSTAESDAEAKAEAKPAAKKISRRRR